MAFSRRRMLFTRQAVSCNSWVRLAHRNLAPARIGVAGASHLPAMKPFSSGTKRAGTGMRCPSCRAENQAGRLYCRECGAPLQLVCEHCRFVNGPEDRFCGGCGRPLAPPPAGRAGAEEPAPFAAERRQVTLVFIDLVGSTTLSERLDPEDMNELYQAYRGAASALVEAYGGCVAQFVGDGILAYFGFPQAQEDDAARAVRAALEIGPAVRRLDGVWNRAARLQLDVRAGVHTGVVVVGTLGSGPHADPLAVVGAPANIAARIQNYAEPGAVMVSGATFRLIEGRFECEDRGRHAMRGLREPVHVLRVLRPSDRLTRFEATRTHTDLVGREAEVERVLASWALATAGRGQIVRVTGEPGIGKSRLVRAVEERIAREPHHILRCQCSPFATQSTLYPVVVGLRRAAAFLPDDSPDERLGKLEALLAAADLPVERTAPLYAALLSLPTEWRYPPLQLTPTRQKDLTLAALVDHVLGLAGQRPTVVVVEDAHWIDPTSLELLDRLAGEVAGGRILLLVTFRPEFTHALPGPPAVEIALQRLAPPASQSLIARVTGGKALPAELADEIVRKTEGVPLFIEELTRTIIESGGLVEGPGGYELRGGLPALGIPSTLQESLLARLDRLGPAKEVAQIAAGIGREFPHRLLAEVAALPAEPLERALGHLAEADLITPSTAPPPGYAFRHALIRDIAYGSLLRPRRQELHGRIARALRLSDPETCEARPELLAYHLTEAGEIDDAVEQWLKAGQRASALSANQEAVDHLSRGLELLRQLPDAEANRQRALQLLISRGPAQILLRGAATAEVAANYREALDLAASLPEGPAHFAAHWGWWFISPDHREQERRGAHLQKLAGRLDNRGLLMQAHHCQWATQLNLGKLEACRQHVEAGLALYDAGAYADEVALYGGHDAKVCGLGNAGIVAWLLGHPETARRRVEEMLAWAPRVRHAASHAQALKGASQVAFFARDHAALRDRSRELAALADQHGFPGYRAETTIHLGWVTAQEGDPAQGLGLVREGLARFRSLSTSSDSPFFANILAELLGMTGAVDEALAELDRAMGEMERGSLRLWLPELQRCYGRLLASRGPAHRDEAEAWLLRAIGSAKAQGAKALLHRAEASLARLRRSDAAGMPFAPGDGD
jgi:class 3 adenylate cyclase/predicted ATPase